MLHVEKELYNTFLRVSRSEKNLPFKYRKNFDKFEDHKDYPYVQKLGRFFKKFPHIKMEQFFSAPYTMYMDNSDYYDLKFYTTPKATRLYGVYIEKLNSQSPDSEYHIKWIKSSLLFMFQFCRDNKLTFNQYTEHMTGDMHTVLQHIRDKNVSPYAVFGVRDPGEILKNYSPDFLDFVAGKNFMERVDLYRSRYYNSNNAQDITVQGISKLTKLLTN